MCNSLAEGGVRCDVHLKTTGALFSYVSTLVKPQLVSEEEIKSIWSSLRKENKDATAPSDAEYAEFLDKTYFRVEMSPGLTEEERQPILNKLLAGTEQNLPSGAGFAAQQKFADRVLDAQSENYKKAQLLKEVRQAEKARLEEASKNSRQAMVEAYENDEEYGSWPVPQANDLDKVATVIDSINHDATTADAIGEAIDVGNRQGSYYANAAGYLGLVEKHKDDIGSTHYALTQAGQAFANSGPAERAAMLAEMVNRTPLGRSYRQNSDPTVLEKEIASGSDSGGYSDTVAKRRLSTLNTWMNTIDNSSALTENISQQQKETIARSVNASIKQRAEQEEKRRQFVTERAVGATCTTCFMVKPISGICPNCD